LLHPIHTGLLVILPPFIWPKLGPFVRFSPDSCRITCDYSKCTVNHKKSEISKGCFCSVIIFACQWSWKYILQQRLSARSTSASSTSTYIYFSSGRSTSASSISIYTYHSPRPHFFPCFASSSSYVQSFSRTCNKKQQGTFHHAIRAAGRRISASKWIIRDTTKTAWEWAASVIQQARDNCHVASLSVQMVVLRKCPWSVSRYKVLFGRAPAPDATISPAGALPNGNTENGSARRAPELLEPVSY
jgi:hypothetical protein